MQCIEKDLSQGCNTGSQALSIEGAWSEMAVGGEYSDRGLRSQDIMRTAFLSSAAFFMMAGYALHSSMKNAVLTANCGVEMIPKAKGLLSTFAILVSWLVYAFLLNESNCRGCLRRKERLFYIFGTFYCTLFAIIAYLMHQGSPRACTFTFISYCALEGYGHIMVTLFWSFANSNFSLRQAERSYGVMVAAAQLGTVLGPGFVKRFVGQSLGVSACCAIGVGCLITLQLIVWVYVRMFGNTSADSTPMERVEEGCRTKNKTMCSEGAYLILEHDYVKGIFAIFFLSMLEASVVDYNLRIMYTRVAMDHFSNKYPCTPLDVTTGEAMACWDADTGSAVEISAEAAEALDSFSGNFGQATNALGIIFSLFGTSVTIRKLGLRRTLLLFPSICILIAIVVWVCPTFYVSVAARMILKASSYALKNPTNEMLYLTTSSSVKYHARIWIDIWSRALGSQVITHIFWSTANTGSLVGISVAGFLIWSAMFVGKKVEEYNESGHIVGETNGNENDAGEFTEINGRLLQNVEKAIPAAE